MSHKIKLLLFRNNGDWRRRSSIILKIKSTFTFDEFATQCAHKVYQNQPNTTYSIIKLYDIQNGLIPIEEEPNTLVSELHEDLDIYRNCNILVVLPLLHKQGIINPSNAQMLELQQEQELCSYLSSNHSLSSISPSINPSPRPFHTLASINNANNGHKSSCVSPKTEKQPHKTVKTQSNHSETTKQIVIEDVVEEEEELVCTLSKEDNSHESIQKNTNNTQSKESINGKRARTVFEPSINNKPRKKRKKRHKKRDNVDIYA
eukprot:116914_1